MCTYYTSENAFYIGGKRKRNMHTAQRRRNTDSILEIVHIRVSLNLNQLQFQPRFGLGSGLARFKRDFNLDTTLHSRRRAPYSSGVSASSDYHSHPPRRFGSGSAKQRKRYCTELMVIKLACTLLPVPFTALWAVARGQLRLGLRRHWRRSSSGSGQVVLHSAA